MNGIPVELAPLFNGGSLACILAWFMFKAEPRMKGMEDAIDRNSKTMLLFILAHDEIKPGVKVQATEMLAEIKTAEDMRNRK